MNKIIGIKTYPGNVLSAVFGEPTESYAYYCDGTLLENTIDDIMQLEFTNEDCAVFFSIYKKRTPAGKVAGDLQCLKESVDCIHSRILRKLRQPRLSKRLKMFTDAVKVIQNDDMTSVSEILSMSDENAGVTVIADHDVPKAFVITPILYDTLKPLFYNKS